MRLIIAGSRTVLPSVEEIDAAVQRVRIIVGVNAVRLVISGTANGGDKAGERWAIARGITIKHMAADWDRFKGVAGFIRNNAMAYEADAVVALWDGESRGTAHMVTTMTALRKPCVVELFKQGHGFPKPPTQGALKGL